ALARATGRIFSGAGVRLPARQDGRYRRWSGLPRRLQHLLCDVGPQFRTAHMISAKPSSKRLRAALFDMDRTLLRVETAILYVRHQRKLGEATWRDAARAAYWLAQ